MKKNVKRIAIVVGAIMAFLLAATTIASACTTIYVGSDRNTEGTPFVARTEDYGSDMNKMWGISEAGKFKAGETYTGCPAYGGFQWTWTHDSYRFTYFTNDVVYDGTCPECGEGSIDNPVTHWSYTESGTNDKGVSVSATETIGGNQAVKKIDPFHNSSWLRTHPEGTPGIEETDIPTVILGEADTAREGLELLMDIYDTRGCWDASGLFISDQNETYYIENCSGTQYVALKLTDDLIFLEPNMAVIGKVDLDDTDNVFASENLIKTAQDAESFVGDADANVIDFRASYSSGITSADARLVQGLNYLNAAYNYDAAALVADNSLFTISNVKEDAIAPIYTKIDADRNLTIEDILGYYHLSTIGKPSNQEIEIFQQFKDRPVEYGTVGWVGVGDMSYGVFVPCYPMLLDSLYDGYTVPAATVQRLTEPAEDGFCTYRSSRWGGEFYNKYPENWRDSYYFTFEGLANQITYAEKLNGLPLTDDMIADLQAKRDQTQKELIEEFVSYEDLQTARNPRNTATSNMKTMAAKAHAYGLNTLDSVKFITTPDLEAHQALVDAMEDVIAANATLASGEYTTESFNALKAAIDKYNELIDSPYTKSDEAAAVMAEVIAAWRTLEPIDKAAAAESAAVYEEVEALAAKLFEVYNMDLSKYKDSSVEAFNAVLADAEAVLADEASTSDQLKAAKASIAKALLKLEKKEAQTLTVKAVKKPVKFAKVKKAKQVVTGAITVKGNQTKVTYAKAGGSAKLTINKAGKITVKKGTKKGTYSIKVKVKAPGNGEYLAATKTVTVKIVVK